MIGALEQVDDRNQYSVFLRRENFEEYKPQNANFKKKLWDAPWYGWREQVMFPRAKFDVMHFPHWNVPVRFASPFILTVHDLILFSSSRLKQTTTHGRWLYNLKFAGFKFVFGRAVQKAKAIIVPSNFVKEQLLDLYPHLRNKVQVIYEAPTITPLRHSERGEESHTLPHMEKEIATLPMVASNDIGDKFVLYVGAAYPHKNLMRLLQAWQRLPGELLNEYKLVLVGRKDFFWQQLESKIKESIVFYGEASDEELASLYSHAALLVQPSLEEGFSLSPLEALSFGCPVAVSDIPVHREISDGAVIFFNPRDENSIMVTIKDALLNQSVREEILIKAKQILSQYSWHNAARVTLELYDVIKKV